MIVALKMLVDTSVVADTGTKLRSPTPGSVHALNAILASGLKTVVTDELHEEWKRHTPKGGPFSTWRQCMYARKRVERVVLKTLPALQARISQHAPTPEIDEIIQKDAHLAAGAIEAGACVIALDDKVRGHFARLVPNVAELGPVHWVNPCRAHEAVPEWLGDGAAHDPARTLVRHR